MTDKNRQNGNEIGDADAGGLAKDIDARQVLSQARSSAFDDCIFAIRGAIAFGIHGTNAPPDGHWLAEFYSIGKKLARPAPEALGAAKGELSDAELRNALTAAANYIDTLGGDSKNARAILAKAKGENA